MGLEEEVATAAALNKSNRGGPPRKWTPSTMDQALNALRTDEIASINEASRIFEIPFSTLQKYVKKEGIIPKSKD